MLKKYLFSIFLKLKLETKDFLSGKTNNYAIKVQTKLKHND